MAFGKRTLAPATTTKPMGRLGEVALPEARLTKLRDHMLSLLGASQRVADAIREESAVAMPVVADESEPEAGPLELKGFHEYFCARHQGGFGHLIFAYGQPMTGGAVDPNAQYHLQQLTGQALAFNLYCQRAHLDEALGVALQSPDVPAVVDALLVRSAFFAAFFDNMLAVLADQGARATAPKLASHRANLERHLLMAQDKMLDPGRRESLTPLNGWPFVGVEIPYAPHDGDYFINGVYFPADHARLLLATDGAQAQLAAVA